MAAKGPRNLVTLYCTECVDSNGKKVKNENYRTPKNNRNTPDKLELMKYCKHCQKKTAHKEKK